MSEKLTDEQKNSEHKRLTRKLESAQESVTKALAHQQATRYELEDFFLEVLREVAKETDSG